LTLLKKLKTSVISKTFPDFTCTKKVEIRQACFRSSKFSSNNSTTMAEGSSKRITVTVKTPKEKQNIECDEDELVEKVRNRKLLIRSAALK
jgi:hypothetical protein